jgi:hypothetical protein
VTIPAGTIAVDCKELERVVTAALAAEKPTLWRSLVSEWMKPTGVGMLLAVVVGAFATYTSVQDATKKNVAQDRILEPIPGQLARITDRLDQADNRQRELLISWNEWRKGVDVSVIGQRDDAKDIQGLTERVNSQDARSTRIYDSLANQLEQIDQRAQRIERDVAVLASKVEIEKKPHSKDAKLQAKPKRAKVIRFARARARGKSQVFLAGLTRSLEKSFGRPYYKRRKWP